MPEDLKRQQRSLVRCFEGIIENMKSMFAADRRSAYGDWTAYLEINSLIAEMNASTSCMNPYDNYIRLIIKHASDIGHPSAVDEIDACFQGIGAAISDSQRLDHELRRAYQVGMASRSHFESAYASALNVMKYMKRCVENDYFY
jgi:hypothetical protein